MPGEGGDRLHLPAHPGQVSQAQVPGRVGGEPRNVSLQRHPADHLRPGPHAERLGVVAPRLRQEQRASRPADHCPVPQVLGEQRPGRRRVRHRPLAAGLGRLRPHPQRPVARVEIIGAQRAQLLPAQRRVIGQRQHHPVADRLAAADLQDLQPFGLAGNPRQPGHPGHQRPPPAASAAETPPGRVTAAAHRVGPADPLLHQEVIEQPDRHQPLPQRGIRQPSTRIERHHVPAPAAGPGPQPPDERGHLGASRGHRVDPAALARLQVLGQAAGIGIDRPRRPAQISPDAQPLGRPLMPPQDGPLDPSRSCSHPPQPPVPVGLR
jgi:hypothetical protein